MSLMKLRPALSGFAAILCALSVSTLLGQAPPKPVRFQADIDRMLERDKTNPPPRDGILFIGSSIFRLWTQLGEQMAPLPVYNRAFGGSVTQDLLDRVDQIVIPYRPRIIVYYCGSNDVNAGEPAGAIIARTKLFLKIVNEKLPDTFVLLHFHSKGSGQAKPVGRSGCRQPRDAAV